MRKSSFRASKNRRKTGFRFKILIRMPKPSIPSLRKLRQHAKQTE